jgi:hypothetical protein
MTALPPRAYSQSEKEQNAKFDQFVADARSGKTKPPAEWVPQRSRLDLEVRQALGIDDAEREPAPLATPGEYSEEAERQFRAKAWEQLDQATQDAAQDEDDPGHNLAADEYALAYNAVVADDKASSLTAQYGQR